MDNIDDLIPDYIGAYYQGPYYDNSNRKKILKEEFRMFIYEKKLLEIFEDSNELNQKIYSISGLLVDNIGKANFKGYLRSKFIDFEVTYFEDHNNNLIYFKRKFTAKSLYNQKYYGFYGYLDKSDTEAEYYSTLRFIIEKNSESLQSKKKILPAVLNNKKQERFLYFKDSNELN
jgi:hypothetical protein